MKYQFVFLKNDAAYDARSKAPKDVEAILSSLGYQPIRINLRQDEPAHKRLPKMLRALLSAVRSLERGSTLVLQYPLTGYFYWIVPLLKLKGIKLIALIHDLESYRWSGALSAKELRDLRHFDRILVHTPAMRQLLQEAGLSAGKLVELQLFDYLAEGQLCTHQTPWGQDHRPEICFAGNLTKSAFLPQLAHLTAEGLTFRLYGAEAPETIPYTEALSYAGGFRPDDLEILRGDWGLVWDGDSITTCSGAVGSYLRINAPHKASLYLTKGIPLIVWSESGIAPFVREHHLGITVSSLEDVPQALRALTPTEQERIHRAVEAFAGGLRQGAQLGAALDATSSPSL